MERVQSEAYKRLNMKCKALAKDLKQLPKDIAECEQPFDMDLEKLDKTRFGLIAAHHELLLGRAPYRISLDNERFDSIRETTLKKQLEDMKIICSIQNSFIQNREKDSELNKDTIECFHEILEVMEDKDDAEVERSETKRKLAEAKAQTNYVLENYPDHQNELLSILEKLEKNQKKEEEREKWLDLSEYDLTPVMILKRAMIIEQHKTKLSFFRFAPLT
ncbi:uncharacterized protein [Halyomorpha halys]|uniref:uncharacterized protein n=1 Tax=Halyomorpha halys TaxID=286706 RepID=UPI0006D50B3B|nr:uncharacterized protein LOC106690081 [Halyomorpha halys]